MQESSSDPPSSPYHLPQDLSSTRSTMHSDGMLSTDEDAMEICSDEDECDESPSAKLSLTEENNNTASCYDLTSKKEFLKSLELETSPRQYQRGDYSDTSSCNQGSGDDETPISSVRSSATTTPIRRTPPATIQTTPTTVYEEEQQDCFVEEFKRMKAMGEFPCRLCPEKFPNLRALKGHNRVHLMASSPMYECNLCPYAHADRSTVVKHMKCHNGERPYECSVCKFAFTTKANCERHFRNRHRGRARDHSQALQQRELQRPLAEMSNNTSPHSGDSSPRTTPTSISHLHQPLLEPMDDDNPLDLSIKKKPQQSSTPTAAAVYGGGMQTVSPVAAAAPHPSLPSLPALHPLASTDPSNVPSPYLGVPPPYLVPPPVYPDLQREVLRGLQLSGGRLVPSDQVKMVVKNGVLVAKQKQRRYRTERPFGCQHCPARFTLRSNMERHVKQQHPELWSQRQRPPGGRRSNRGGGALVSMVPNLDHSSREIPIDVKTALYEQIKSRTNTLQTSIAATSTPTSTVVTTSTSSPPPSLTHHQDKDLASVSQMVLNAASTANSLTKYFLPSSMDRVNGLDNDHSSNSSGSDERSSPNSSNESLSGNGRSGGGNGGGVGNNKGGGVHGASGGGGKKRSGCSAYSLAPNRVTCPYCSRQFPWSSSLRRHVLTHTGQKPYKCTSCHLLFTTKSNCDRHMSRKHSRKSSTVSAGEEDREDREDKSQSTGVSVKTQTDSNVATSPRTSTSPISPEHNEGVETPFKCHLCDASFTERSATLEHIKHSHARDYALLAVKGALDSCDETDDQDAANNDHPNRKVTCAFCLRRFWSAEDLRRHVRSHTGERPFSCHLCHRRFTLKHSMLRHLKKHNINNNISNNNNNNNNNNSNNKNKNNNEDKSSTPSPELSRPNDLISNLLGMDKSIIDTMLESGPSHAARILGVDSGS